MEISENEKQRPVSILWFRHGLRIHDNRALLEALSSNYESDFLPLFIFDGESAGTKVVGYNRMRFLIESLEDLNESFNKFGGCIRILKGDPVTLFKKIHERTGILKICFEQDCEPIWKPRDENVKRFCKENGISAHEFVSHTLWDPIEILEANGGSPPLTYASFLFVVSTLNKPPRPVEAPDAETQSIKFYNYEQELPEEILFPLTPDTFGIEEEGAIPTNVRRGGEQRGLALLVKRLELEKSAFEQGLVLPNHSHPDLMMGMSLSPALRFGNVSIRKLYWSLQDLFQATVGWRLKNSEAISVQTFVGQLFWREYFYVMSVPNPYYDQMKPNPICLNIPWSDDAAAKERLNKWKDGKTGYPFIDAAMRQLTQEGWLHHVTRNAVACFLTRGDLWVSWEEGLKHFLKYLLDADWSVCAGNWMWVSSSAFENILDCSQCVCPTNYAQRLDPEATFIKRFLPELKNFPAPYIFEPWTAPMDLQYKWGCIVGKDYPRPIVDHRKMSQINKEEMLNIRNRLQNVPVHACPSDTNEARQFMWLSENCDHAH